jgi:tetratricopeptide (TPR) repeat protein
MTKLVDGEEKKQVGEPPQVQVFLSYSRADIEKAKSLKSKLERSGIGVFRDVDDTLPGEEWWQRLTDLIAQAEAVVFLLSSRSAASKVCADEVDFARSLNKRIFPAAIEIVDWSSVSELRKYHSVSLIDERGRDAAVESLISSLKTNLDWVRAHTRVLQRARQWQMKGHPNSELLRGDALEDAEQWLTERPVSAEPPNKLHYDYIKASRDEDRAERERRIEEAERQRAAMQEQRDRAERALAAATTTANTLVQDLTNEFRDAVGMRADLREKLLERANRLLGQLVESGEDAPSLRRSQAISLSESASALKAQGRLAEARAALDKGMSIIDELLITDANNVQLQSDRSKFFAKIGDIVLASSEKMDALTFYRQNLEINESLAQHEPNDFWRQRDLAESLAKMGDGLIACARIKEAIKFYSRGADLFQQLTAMHPMNEEFQMDLAGFYERVGFAHELDGNLTDALAAYRVSVAAVEKQMGTQPNNTYLKRELATRYGRLSNLMIANGQFDEALQSLRNTAAMFEDLQAADPKNTDIQRDLAVAHVRIGDVLFDREDYNNSFEQYKIASRIHDALIEVDPQNTQWHDDRIANYKRRCDLLIKIGRADLAKPTLYELLNIAQFLENCSPDKVWKLHIARICYTLAVIGDNVEGNKRSALASLGALSIKNELTEEQRQHKEGLERLLHGL